jgi:hypothetical protein
MTSPKYPRTYHLPWSLGATNDDKIAKSVEGLLNREVLITEKLDGSNVSLEADGVFARSHSGPPPHASFDLLKSIHARVKWQLAPDYQVFGEWCYAHHSIAYDALPGYLLLFGARDLVADVWTNWSVVEEWATDLGVHTVPVIGRGTFTSEDSLRKFTEDLTAKPSLYGAVREGLVVRTADGFDDKDFDKCVAKMVRAGHVAEGSEHWAHKEIVKNKLKEIV